MKQSGFLAFLLALDLDPPDHFGISPSILVSGSALILVHYEAELLNFVQGFYLSWLDLLTGPSYAKLGLGLASMTPVSFRVYIP